MKTLSPEFTGYGWAPSTAEIARLAGIDPIEVIRYDGNVAPAPLPSSRPGAIAGALARTNTYAHGGYPELLDAIARYAGVGTENIVLGAGADDLILLCARAFAGPGDNVAVADDPTYPLFRIAAWLAGAEVGDDDPVLTYCCRPNNPTGALDPLPEARPLAVDEAYFEYCNETAVDLIEDGVIVIRTFSKAFGLAGLRIGCLVGAPATVDPIRQAVPVYSVNIAAVVAVQAALSDRDHLHDYLRQVAESKALVYAACDRLGVTYWKSRANFVLVCPGDRTDALVKGAFARGIYLRDRSTEPGCAGCLRVATGIVTHTKQALAVMEEVLCAAR
jgi:histidinol-phosphate aminotransferase